MSQLIYAIIHELKKEANTSTFISFRDTILPFNQSLDLLFTELINIYDKKATKGLGKFNPDNNTYPFNKDLKTFLFAFSEYAFIQFSKNAMNHIKSRIETENFAVGGYILFFLYKYNNKYNVFIGLLRNTQGCIITSNLGISNFEHLDINNLHIGCRIEPEEWLLNSESPYITFIKGSTSRSTPEYFLKAIGCSEFTNSKSQTRTLLTALKAYADYKNLTIDEKSSINKKVHDHCNEYSTVDINALSILIDPSNPSDFFEFVNDNNYKIGFGFEPDKKILKTLLEITTKGDGIKLSFPAIMLGDRIVCTQSNGEQQIIIKNPPEAMWNTLIHQ